MTKSTFPIKTIEAEFCVVGGGMAGLCAALAAARNGTKTVLVQDRPVLGGNASSEIRMWICGATGPENDKPESRETGILEELFLSNRYHNPMRLYPAWDHILYGACLEQDNLTTLLNCTVHDLTMQDNRIAAIQAWHLTQQCRYEISAPLFADCSGDSVLHVSGAETRWGREAKDEFDEDHEPETADRKTMGNSILIQLRETDRHIPFTPPNWAYHYTEDTVPNRNLQPDGGNFWWLEVGGTQDTIADADSIRDELLKIAYGIWAYIKNHPDGRGRNWELDWIGSLPGKRENIRYVGDYILTQNDIEAEGRFEDLVAFGGWTMDDHHPDAIEYPGNPPTIHHPAPSPYGIPYRCLYSRSIENLFCAGRNISVTHMALSSTRVMATCAVMGQAVGTAAAIASAHELTPRRVYRNRIDELKTTLMEQDCYLPWHTRTIPPLSREAELSASSGNPQPLLDGIERDLNGTDHGWWGGPDDWVAYTWNREIYATKLRLVLDSDMAREKEMLCRYPKDQEPAAMPRMLARQLAIDVRNENGEWTEVCRLNDNHNRLITVEMSGEPINCCCLRILQTWGGDSAHVFGFDVT